MKPFIILLAGGIGSGKDTVADYLRKTWGFSRVAFADPLKDITASLFEYPTQWGYDRELKEQKPLLGNGKKVGEILQLFGTEVARNINPHLWVSKAQTTIHANKLERVAIPDCRFQNEAEVIMEREPNSFLICLTRRPESMLRSRDAGHASENQDWTRLMTHHPKYGDRVFTIDNARQQLGETYADVGITMTGIINRLEE